MVVAAVVRVGGVGDGDDASGSPRRREGVGRGGVRRPRGRRRVVVRLLLGRRRRVRPSVLGYPLSSSSGGPRRARKVRAREDGRVRCPRRSTHEGTRRRRRDGGKEAAASGARGGREACRRRRDLRAGKQGDRERKNIQGKREEGETEIQRVVFLRDGRRGAADPTRDARGCTRGKGGIERGEGGRGGLTAPVRGSMKKPCEMGLLGKDCSCGKLMAGARRERGGGGWLDALRW